MDATGEAALIQLTAFIGSVIGLTGCLAGALVADATLTATAAIGSLVCGCLWFRLLKCA